MLGIEQAYNTATYKATPIYSVSVKSGEQSAPREWKTVQQFQIRQNTKLIVSPDNFIWLELSMVPEIECVFVERRGDVFSVLSVVNDRDMNLRKRIFAREKAIIDALHQFEFDFDILTRMNHSLDQLMLGSNKPAFIRR